MPAELTLCERCQEQPGTIACHYAHAKTEILCMSCMIKEAVPTRSPLPVNGEPARKVDHEKTIG